MASKSLRVVSAFLLAIVFVMPAALAVATNGMEPSAKVLVWTETPGAADEMRNAGLTVLEEYGSFALVSGKASALKHFDVMETSHDLEKVDLGAYVIDHKEPVIADDLRVDSYGETGHYIVQFYGPIKQAWLDDLASKGAVVGQYLPYNGYIVYMDRTASEAIVHDHRVHYVGLYQPAYKLQPGILERTGTVDVLALVFSENDLVATLEDISEFGEITSLSTYSTTMIDITMDASDIPRLARMDAIKWVQPQAIWVPYTTEATWIVQSGVQGSTPMYDHGIHGENQTVFNSDTGMWVTHDAYRDSAHSVQYSTPGSNNAPDATHRKIVNYWTFADSTDAGGFEMYHGTHTNGVTAGDATPSGGNFKGIAWAAKISFGDIFFNNGGSSIPNDLGQLFVKGFNDGASVSSNSWGQPWSSGVYDAHSQSADQFMWDHKDMQVNFAAGNDGSNGGSVSTPSTAKNVLAIGAAEHDNTGTMMGYSSRGPTQDGRIKPEILVPTDEIGPCGGSTCADSTYASAGGTSNACPTATGGTALVRQYFTDGFYPSGAKNSADAFTPTSALIRAATVNGGIEKQGTGAHDHPYNGMPFPNNDQGFGYMNLHNSLVFQGDPKMLYVEDHKNGLTTGQTVEYYFNVIDNTIPFKVSVAWTDPAGQTSAGTELVNNLDLTVDGPGGSYKGNVFRTAGAHESSPNTGSLDAKNVIEQFLLLTPQVGGYTVKVTATNVAQGSQPFAIVVNGKFVRDPDLALLKTEFKVEPQGTPTEGDKIYFNGTVHNYGGLVTQLIPMDILVDGKKEKGIDFDLSVLDRKDFSYEWTAVAGNHRFVFVIDPLGVIDEADENNNQVNASIWVNGVPHANISLGPDNPLTLMDVIANASMSIDDGPITYFKFDFGDGYKTQWQKGPTAAHQFKDDGIYNVTAWVKDNMSVVSAPATLQVTVLNRLPYVNATAATYKAYTYTEIAFDGVRSYDPDGKITWLWDFGDGATNTTNRPMHTWTDNGFYNVTLKVTDDDGGTNTTKVLIEILNQAPTASFSANLYRGNATTEFEFDSTGKDKDGHIAKWVWDFGDGNKSSEQNPTHHFADDGEYNVSFYTVDDDGALSAVLNKTVIIDNLAPIANFTANTYEALTYEDIKFMDLSKDLDGRIVTVNWDMGDGKVFRNSSVTYQFRENGQYTVKLTVQDDDDAISTFEAQVVIKNRAPVAKALYNSTVHVGNLLVLMANQSTDRDGQIKTYIWTFNGTEKKYGQTITYAFWEVGLTNFTLTVVDNDGAMNTANLSIDITKKPTPPPINIGGAMSLWMILLIVILIGCVVGAIIGATMYKRKQAKQKRMHPGAEKIATVPLTTSMELESASSGKASTTETPFESAYQHQAYGKVEAYPFYGKEIETATPSYDYGPGYDSSGAAAETPTEAPEPEVEDYVEAPQPVVVEAQEEVEEEEIPIKPVIVEHEAVVVKAAEPPEETPEKPADNSEKNAKEIKESNDLDEILNILNETK